MKQGDNYLKLTSVEDGNNYFGYTTYHPQVSVINLNEINTIRNFPKIFGIYVIACYWDATIPSTDEAYNTFLMFYAPGQYGKNNTGVSHNPTGYVLMFDEELLQDTLLHNKIREFPFFSNYKNNIIRLTCEEREWIVNCMRSIQEEIKNPMDKYSAHILASGIAVLLTISMRYYERQVQRTSGTAYNIITRLNNILDRYIHTPPSIDKEIPTVSSCALELGISPNYLGDVVHNTIKISAHSYIQSFIISEAKRLMEFTTMSIGEIAYHLGFKYPHHLTRVFKKSTGLTPGQFRGKRTK